ncbi:histidinol-phosphate transaminase [Leptothermofonsia sp. ETS-13]|uniref:histidinol-phosphate transaminase n=1 Tax=Leptothermofonsia sp. ETS-13 TaxID=3035696 RepID=UPI003B9FB59E
MLSFIRSDLAQLKVYTPHAEENLTSTQESIKWDHLDTNESPFDLPEELKQKLALTYQKEIQANRYPDGGHLALKRAIADYVNKSAELSVDAFNSTHVSIGNGSDELIRSLLIATCLRGEGSILVAEPTFSMYAILAQTLGIPVVAVGRSPINFEMDWQAAQTVISQSPNPPIRVVFVVHPNSPTGNALTEAEISWLKSLPEEILVVIDEAYFEFSQTTLVNEVLQRPNWVILRTFSKAFRLAAHRIGYAIAHSELTTVLEKVRLPYNLPAFTQAAALTALTYRQELFQSIPKILEQREHIIQSLKQYSTLTVWSSAANFVYVRLNQQFVNNQISLEKIYHQLKSKGTLIRYISGGLRITIGCPDENARMLTRLDAALKHFLGAGLSE